MITRPATVVLSITLGFASSNASAQLTSQSTVTDVVRRLHWRSVGPANNAGRVSVVAGVPGNRDVYYVAGANGGIIKTLNGGVTFKPIFDTQDVGSIGASELRVEADQAQARLDAIVSTRITRINQSLAGTPHVITPPTRVIVP